MKKSLNRGFSLAEVLISIGIVSVIAMFGFTLTKKNLDRAYNMYVYTGTKALSDAITDAELREEDKNIIALGGRLAELFGTKECIWEEGSDNVCSITARNNIVYKISYMGDSIDNIPIYSITMTLPVKKTKQDSVDKEYGFYHYKGNKTDNYPSLFLIGDFADRDDLIKYYIKNNNNSSSNITYYSFRQAACKNLTPSSGNIYASINATEQYHLLDCTNTNPEKEEGTLVMVRP